MFGPPIEYEELSRLFAYNPNSGEVTWLVDQYSGIDGTKLQVAAGSVAGWAEPDGSRRIQIMGKAYQTTHIIWCLQTGTYPPRFVDHINGNRSDNRWSNLRAATDAQNARNRRLHKKNKSGCSGVLWIARLNKWRATISVNYQTLYLGCFSDLQDAIRSRIEAEKTHFGEFRRE